LRRNDVDLTIGMSVRINLFNERPKRGKPSLILRAAVAGRGDVDYTDIRIRILLIKFFRDSARILADGLGKTGCTHAYYLRIVQVN